MPSAKTGILAQETVGAVNDHEMRTLPSPILNNQWHVPAGVVRLDFGTIDLWRIDLDAASVSAHPSRGCLSYDELQRAEVYRDELGRARFLASRVAVRHILAGYLRASPASLVFAPGPYGKPGLTSPQVRPPLHFNLAHSEGLALCAVAHVEVGVDVEKIRPGAEIEDVSSQMLSQEELAPLQALNAKDRRDALYVLWTCKEACAKATGLGLSLDLPRVTILPRLPADPSAWFAVEMTADSARWSAIRLVPEAGFVGAVVLRGEPLGLRLRQFDPSPSSSAG
jgi:4'-phosphopantetheinyl transferase